MSEKSLYSVIIDGSLQIGFEPDKVTHEFAQLFKIPPEKAQGLLDKKRILKKRIDSATAQKYKTRLEAIGLVVHLKEHKQALEPTGGLSLVPTENETDSVSPSKRNLEACPKCDHKQPAGQDQCESCGVYLHKVTHTASKDDTDKISKTYSSQPVIENSFKTSSIVTGIIAAVAGAYLWSLIAELTEYEFGLIAWVIGGIIGFVVAVTGSRGQAVGVFCAILALMAIIGGKYLVYDGFKDQLGDIFAGSKEEMRYMYNMEMDAAKAFREVTDEASLKTFLAEFEYSDAYAANKVTQEEIDAFKEDDQVALTQYAYAKPKFDDWYQTRITDRFVNISTFDLMQESFGALDILFLLLGISTAFRIGRGETA